LGRALARRLGVAFVELVKEIETEAGMRLSEIFDLYGQSVYRRYERQALERAIRVHDRAVIATGGGLPTEPGTFALLRKHCRLIWLRATPEEHMARVRAQGDTRPMAGNRQAMDDLRQILAQRAALYRQADAVLDTSGQTVGQSLDELFALIQLSQPITA
jgi:XRE family aerobic/anaerobic benzoate catabolism transcriptional regulator